MDYAGVARRGRRSARGRGQRRQTTQPLSDTATPSSAPPDSCFSDKEEFPELPPTHAADKIRELELRREEIKRLGLRDYGVALQFAQNSYTVTAGTEIFTLMMGEAIMQSVDAGLQGNLKRFGQVIEERFLKVEKRLGACPFSKEREEEKECEDNQTAPGSPSKETPTEKPTTIDPADKLSESAGGESVQG
jgi:hypothetical protein